MTPRAREGVVDVPQRIPSQEGAEQISSFDRHGGSALAPPSGNSTGRRACAGAWARQPSGDRERLPCSRFRFVGWSGRPPPAPERYRGLESPWSYRRLAPPDSQTILEFTRTAQSPATSLLPRGAATHTLQHRIWSNLHLERSAIRALEFARVEAPVGPCQTAHRHGRPRDARLRVTT